MALRLDLFLISLLKILFLSISCLLEADIIYNNHYSVYIGGYYE